MVPLFKTLFLSVSVRVFLDEMNIELVDSVNCPPQCGQASPNLQRV